MVFHCGEKHESDLIDKYRKIVAANKMKGSIVKIQLVPIVISSVSNFAILRTRATLE